MNDAANTTNTQAPELDNLKRDYIGPAEMAERGQSAVEDAIRIAEHFNLPITWTFEPDEPLPFGYGVGIVPLTKQAEKKGDKVVKYGLVIAQIPDPQLLLAVDPESPEDAPRALYPEGEAYIREKVLQSFLNKVAQSKKSEQEDGAAAMPVSVQDFIATRGGSLEAFRAFVDVFVSNLKKKKFQSMTGPLLKQILSSRAMAEQLHDTVPQEIWEGVLDAMIQASRSKGMDPGVLLQWRQNRDTVEIAQPENVDMSDLLDLVTADIQRKEAKAAEKK